jgi:hypothetical protein
MLKIEIKNAGDRERAHPRFRRSIAAICCNTDWLKVGESDVSVTFVGRETVQPGPVDIDVHLPSGLPKPAAAESHLLATAICTRVSNFYFENGYRRRQVRVAVSAENGARGEPACEAVWSTH